MSFQRKGISKYLYNLRVINFWITQIASIFAFAVWGVFLTFVTFVTVIVLALYFMR